MMELLAIKLGMVKIYYIACMFPNGKYFSICLDFYLHFYVTPLDFIVLFLCSQIHTLFLSLKHMFFFGFDVQLSIFN